MIHNFIGTLYTTFNLFEERKDVYEVEGYLYHIREFEELSIVIITALNTNIDKIMNQIGEKLLEFNKGNIHDVNNPESFKPFKKIIREILATNNL